MLSRRPNPRDLALLAGGSMAGFLLARLLGRARFRGHGRRADDNRETTEVLAVPAHSRAVGHTLEELGLVAPEEDPGAANMTSEGGPLTGAETLLPPVPSAVPLGAGPVAHGVRLVAVVRGKNPMTDVDPRLALRAGDTLVVTGDPEGIGEVVEQVSPAERTAPATPTAHEAPARRRARTRG